MITLIKKSLLDKKFYRVSFKKVSRKRTLVYLIFICLLYSFIVSPLHTYSGYNAFVNFKKEISKLPTALEIEIKNGEMTSNFSKPLVLKVASDSIIVVDPQNKFNSYEKNTSYIVFKQRGLVTSYNEEFSNQEYTGLSDLKLNSKYIIAAATTLKDFNLSIILGLFYLITNFLVMLTEIVTTVIIFSGVYYALSRFFLNNKLTYLQICKKLIFLSIYLVFGYAICEILGIINPYFPIIIFGISYFYFIARNTK